MLIVWKGGLALLWNSLDKLSFQSYSNRNIDLLVSSESQGDWRLTRFYSNPQQDKHRFSRHMLHLLHAQFVVP